MPLRPPDARLGKAAPRPLGTSTTDLVIAKKRAYGRSVGRARGMGMAEQLGGRALAGLVIGALLFLLFLGFAFGILE